MPQGAPTGLERALGNGVGASAKRAAGKRTIAKRHALPPPSKDARHRDVSKGRAPGPLEGPDGTQQDPPQVRTPLRCPSAALVARDDASTMPKPACGPGAPARCPASCSPRLRHSLAPPPPAQVQRRHRRRGAARGASGAEPWRLEHQERDVPGRHRRLRRQGQDRTLYGGRQDGHEQRGGRLLQDMRQQAARAPRQLRCEGAGAVGGARGQRGAAPGARS